MTASEENSVLKRRRAQVSVGRLEAFDTCLRAGVRACGGRQQSSQWRAVTADVASLTNGQKPTEPGAARPGQPYSLTVDPRRRGRYRRPIDRRRRHRPTIFDCS